MEDVDLFVDESHTCKAVHDIYGYAEATGASVHLEIVADLGLFDDFPEEACLDLEISTLVKTNEACGVREECVLPYGLPPQWCDQVLQLLLNFNALESMRTA